MLFKCNQYNVKDLQITSYLLFRIAQVYSELREENALNDD